MTKGILRQASVAGAIAAGAILAASGTANAVAPDADDMTSVGNNGLGNGSQVLAPIQAPINLCGNSVAVLGVSGAGC
ncbi:MAG TPA: chaplin, partial [Candidatus Stackebrandtia faecavium]|nr:chaplin [Candidatus Stackebrandtia faecavium]